MVIHLDSKASAAKGKTKGDLVLTICMALAIVMVGVFLILAFIGGVDGCLLGLIGLLIGRRSGRLRKIRIKTVRYNKAIPAER